MITRATKEDSQILSRVTELFGQGLEKVDSEYKVCLLEEIVIAIADQINTESTITSEQFSELVGLVKPLSLAGRVELAITILNQLHEKL